MDQKFITRRPSLWLNKGVWAILVLGGLGVRFWLGPRDLHGPFDAALLAFAAAGLLYIGDPRESSRYRGLRVLGRIMKFAFAASLIFAAYRVLVGK